MARCEAGGGDRAQGAVAGRSRRGRPGADRASERTPQCLRHGDRGPRACRGAPGRGRGDARRAARAPPRRALLGQGHARHGGHPHHDGRGALRRSGARRGRGRRIPAPGRRRDPRRKDDDARVCPQGGHRQRALRRHAEPLGARSHLRRVERGRGGGGGHRDGAARGGHRRGRLDPDPGELLRRRGPQADVRADRARPGGRRGDAHAPGAALPHGRGRRLVPFGHRRARRP